MNTINDHYVGIMAMLVSLIVFFSLACISAFGLWAYYRVERMWASHVRRHKRRVFRYQGDPGAFKSRPFRGHS
jgi:hypothetical protein